MKKISVNPSGKAKPVKKSTDSRDIFSRGMSIGFVLGFAAGAAIVAVIDYLDAKHQEMRRIEKGSDADYYYTTE